MIALILNSGRGSRMGELTATHPKCMTEIKKNETIISRQLRMIEKVGIKEVVITTGYYDRVLEDYCNSLNLNLNLKYVKNERFAETNYIYSIYNAREYLNDDLLLMHGDLVFDYTVIKEIVDSNVNCVKVSSTLPLPEKDFKAVVENGKITKIGVEYFENAFEAQALYRLKKNTWKVWSDRIALFCEIGNDNCYAEKALNEVTNQMELLPYDAKNRLCTEIDTYEDLIKVKELIANE